MKIAALAAGVAALLIGSAAMAQEAIPTAANNGNGDAPAVSNSGGPVMISNKKDMHDDRGPMPVGPCGGVAKSVDGGPPQPDKDPHGSVWAGAGTRGYREVGADVCVPIGDNAALNIAVDSTQWGNRRH